jgi:hypothetical protein
VAATVTLGARTFAAEVLNNRHCHLVLVTGRLDSNSVAA